MEADAGPVPMPTPAPSSEQDPDPEEGAQAEFVALHGPALRASGVPERYWGRLLHKLEHEVRAGATRGGRGWGREHRGAERALGARGGLFRTLPRRRKWAAGLSLAQNRGFSGWEASWIHLGKAGRPHGGHVRMRLGRFGGALGVQACCRNREPVPRRAGLRETHRGVSRGVGGGVDRRGQRSRQSPDEEP